MAHRQRAGSGQQQEIAGTAWRTFDNSFMQVIDDTIVALSTAPGRSAIAVVRVSGRDAHKVSRQLAENWPSEARRVRLLKLHDPRDDSPIDDVVLTRFDAPSSYTGEDMVEIACHGGSSATTALIGALIALGAREATAGEFTRRAVLNGKIDILQAEGIGDLIDAGTTAARKVALSQMDGGLSKRIEALREAVLKVEALIAYDLDFPEEDDGPIPGERIVGAAREVIRDIVDLIATAPLAEIAQDGAVVVIAGSPNVGKSSLFNALLGSRRAIVTDVPGTTRDALEATLDSRRWPIRLVDTAGLRETRDVVERLGIEIAEGRIKSAHVVLACGDDGAEIERAEHTIRRVRNVPVVRVLTKADRAGVEAPEGAIAVSSVTGVGLKLLLEAIDSTLDASLGMVPVDRPILTRARHRRALEAARDEMQQFVDLWEQESVPAVIAAVHVRSASGALDELIGSVDVEDVLDRVFSTFCVGK